VTNEGFPLTPGAGGPPFCPFSDRPSTRVPGSFGRLLPAERAGSTILAPAMSGHLKCFYGHQHSHFIACSCYRPQPLFTPHARKDLFLAILEQVRESGVNLGSPKGEPKLLVVRPFAAGPGSPLPPSHQRPAQRSGHPGCWLIRKRKTPAWRQEWGTRILGCARKQKLGHPAGPNNPSTCDSSH